MTLFIINNNKEDACPVTSAEIKGFRVSKNVPRPAWSNCVRLFIQVSLKGKIRLGKSEKPFYSPVVTHNNNNNNNNNNNKIAIWWGHFLKYLKPCL